MVRTSIQVATVSLAAIVCLAACSSGNSPSSGSKGLPGVINVTMVGDMTGFGAEYGKSYRQGAEIAIDEINESDQLGSAKIKLTVADTGSDPRTASSAVSSATRSNAVAILGPTLSSEGVAAAPIAQQAHIPYLSDEASTGTQQLGEWVYNMSPAQVNQAPVLAKYIASKAKSVGIIYANDNPSMVDLHTAFAKAVLDSGATVSGVYGTPIAATDFTALTTEVMTKSPEAIVILGGGAMIPSVANQLRTSGYSGQLYGNMGADGSLRSAGKASEGFTYVTQWVPQVKSTESTNFVKRYDKKFPNDTPIYTAMDGYESMKFLGLALAKVQSVDRGKVLEGLQSVAKDGFTSPSGDVKFGGKSGRLKVTPGIVVKYESGKLLPQG